ncbi:phosphate uptake regulator PhoU [Candidatus Woesearchaeota archaeon]|nr:phosphate uptake regulator PhoU [Candidatus Woesearchaeota archaeon]
MKRKIVKQGAATLMVSLPAKWAKRFALKKGDEVSLEEVNDSLVLTSEAKERALKVVMDVSNLYPLVKRFVFNKYVQGVDEIILTSKKPELLADIPDVVKAGLVGFEVVEQSKNKIVMKQVSHVSEEEFDVMLRRLFLLVKMMGSDLVSALNNKEKNLSYVVRQDENVNRFSSFCMRTINKRVRNTIAENSALYSIVFLIENLGDCYKMLAKLKSNEKLTNLLADVNDFYSDYISLFYDFKVDSAVAFSLRHQKLKSLLEKTKVSSAEDAKFLGLLQQCLNYVILMLNNQMVYGV